MRNSNNRNTKEFAVIAPNEANCIMKKEGDHFVQMSSTSKTQSSFRVVLRRLQDSTKED